LLRRLETAKEYIEANFLHITSICEIAKTACMSEYHFSRSFRAAYEISPYQYVLQQRLAYAQSLMKQMPGAALKEIAALCMFPDIASFSKAYKKCFNTSPSMLRR
jgi:AraC family transcriptional regulator